MSNTQNLDLKKMDGNPKVVNFNHKEFYENNFDKIDDAVGAKPADLTTTAKTIIPAINELKSDKADKTYVDDQDAALNAQLAEIAQDVVDLDTAKAPKSDIGLLSGLLTTAKTSIVAAINELFNSKANKAQEAWITPPLLNGWTTSVSTPQFMKDSLGFVHFRGRMASGTNGSVAFVLPAGYRPAVTSGLLGMTAVGTDGRVNLYSNGNFEVSTYSQYLYLDSITFKAEG